MDFQNFIGWVTIPFFLVAAVTVRGCTGQDVESIGPGGVKFYPSQPQQEQPYYYPIR